jgi:Fe-S-cluster-containing hydrogenase component 2
MQPESFQNPVERAKQDSAGIDELRDQIRIMEEQLAALKERIRGKESPGRESHLVARVVPEKCSGCRACQDVCPAGAISFVGSVARIETSDCTGCGRCAEVCPRGAIVLEAA